MRKKRSEQDYHDLAHEKGMLWVGHKVPFNTLTKTGWECRQGHLWEARWADVWMGRTCPTCKGKDRMTRKDYENLALKHGIYFIGPMPEGQRDLTWWELPGKDKIRVQYTYRYLHDTKRIICPENAEVVRKIMQGS